MDIRSFQLNLFVDRHVLGAPDARAGRAIRTPASSGSPPKSVGSEDQELVADLADEQLDGHAAAGGGGEGGEEGLVGHEVGAVDAEPARWAK
jgi:hypothetical protein